MRVAVLGGGMQGCCIALLLADRGVKVTLFERHAELLKGAASNNEGKIHLGYTYAGDPSLRTARRMIEGALAFAPVMESILGRADAFNLSTPFAYVVHRDSQVAVDDFARYLDRVHDDLLAAAGTYFGAAPVRPRRYARGDFEAAFDGKAALAAFETPEIAVDPQRLCAAIHVRVAAEPNIELRLGHTVTDVADQGARYVVVTEPRGDAGAFDHVVNALWDGRLALDARRGHHPRRAWLHRLKYGFRFFGPAVRRSVTLVLGPFGDTVAYADGARYMSWYPACMRATSSALLPPEHAVTPEELAGMREQSARALGAVMPEVLGIDLQELKPVSGIITAWGETDIGDPQSELRTRHEIGLTSVGGYHSVDPGKFTMIPYFALACADRISPRAA